MRSQLVSARQINSAYEAAVAEYATGVIRPGIQARARIESQQSGLELEPIYLRLLAEQILEEDCEEKSKSRRDAIISSSAGIVRIVARWFKHWLGYSLVGLLALTLVAITVGFQLLDDQNPASSHWGFESKLGGAAAIGARLFIPSALILTGLFLFQFFRDRWQIAAALALLPGLYTHADFKSGIEARDTLESLRSESAYDSTDQFGDNLDVPNGGLSDAYREKVAELQRVVATGGLARLEGSSRSTLSEQYVELDDSISTMLEANNTFWFEGGKVHVHLVNHSSEALAAIEFLLTRGPCAKRYGGPISTKVVFPVVVPSKTAAVVEFEVPKGVDQAVPVSCGVISRSWRLDSGQKASVDRPQTLRESGWTPGPAHETYGLSPKPKCPTQINSKYYRDCDGSVKEGVLK